ncbi:hypothetical protein D3C75_1080590 [compost metagenome]
MHFFPRRQIAALLVAGQQVAEYHLHHFFGHRIAEVAGLAGDIGLQGMTQHIHPGIGGNAGRHRLH